MNTVTRLLTVSALAGVLPAQHAGEWSLNETSGTTASDSSSNNNHGTLKNFTGTPWGPGKLGNALSFDGVDDFVEIPAGAQIPVYDGMGSAYSVMYWIKGPKQNVTRVYAEGNGGGGSNTGPLFTFGSGKTSDGNDDKFQFLLRNDAKQNKCRVYSKAVVYDDTWHHVAFVDVSGVITLYVDGVLDSNLAYIAGREPGSTGWGTFTFDRVAIGALLRATPSVFMKGAIDDLRVYDFAVSASDLNFAMLGVSLLPCSASLGKFGISNCF